MSEVIDLTLHQHAETEKAYLVSEDGDRAKAVWLPKSQCERDRKIGLVDPVYEFQVAVWKAKELNLV